MVKLIGVKAGSGGAGGAQEEAHHLEKKLESSERGRNAGVQELKRRTDQVRQI